MRKFRVWDLETVDYTVNDRREMSSMHLDMQLEDEELIRQICAHTNHVNDNDLKLEWECAENEGFTLWLVTDEGEYLIELEEF